MDVTIRPCEPADAPALALVGKATFLETYAGVLEADDILAHCDTEHGQARYAAWLGKPGYRFWIAEAGERGAPVGYAMLSPPDLPVAVGAGDLELKRIYVLHRFHDTGLGARLMAAVLDNAAAQAPGASCSASTAATTAPWPSTPGKASAWPGNVSSGSARATTTTWCWPGPSEDGPGLQRIQSGVEPPVCRMP